MEKECIFCKLKENTKDVLFSTRYFYGVYDKYPVTNKHILIISKRHVERYDQLRPQEAQNLNWCINKAISYLKLTEDIDVSKTDDGMGYNIGINNGEVAGQTVHHFHCHVIPRRKGDTEKPEGGVRGVIPEKQSYLKTMKVCLVPYTDKPNLNGRIYQLETIEQMASEFKAREHSTYGQIGYPENDYAMQAITKISHEVTDVWVENGQLWGEIKILETEEGDKLDKMLRNNMIAFRSRSFGVLNEDMTVNLKTTVTFDAIDKMQDGFIRYTNE